MLDKQLFNNKILRSCRKDLRKNQTEAERLIWYKLRNRQILNLKFFRQFSVGPYILDFYCPSIKLAVELDGSQHAQEDVVLYDKDRERYLSNFDIKIVRFWNNEVVKNIDLVLAEIITAVSPLKIRGARGVMKSNNNKNENH